MKQDTNHIHPHAAAAVSTFEADAPKTKRKKGKFRANGLRTIYALVATSNQVYEDSRLEAIEDFVKLLRKRRRGAVRSFVIDALYTAIEKRAEQAAAANKDDTFIQS